jgi:hypothetical protein
VALKPYPPTWQNTHPPSYSEGHFGNIPRIDLDIVISEEADLSQLDDPFIGARR